MPDIEFIFPNLDDTSDENNTHEAENTIPDNSSSEDFSAEELLSGIIDARYVSLDNNDIDISQFPALRNALGLNSAESIESVLSYEENDIPQADDTDNTAYPELPKEEPIPSIFEGIGRSDWTSFERELLMHETEIQEDGSVSADTAESAEEPEDEEIIDTDYLLDYIDDIEFSGMDAEPLSPVKIFQMPSDPYNSSFNAPSSEDDELPEFDMTDQFIFEEK